jgi:hypothetical protein
LGFRLSTPNPEDTLHPIPIGGTNVISTELNNGIFMIPSYPGTMGEHGFNIHFYQEGTPLITVRVLLAL